MTKKQRDNPLQEAANFNWAIVDLFNLPDNISFQIRKHSSKTLTEDMRDEHFIDFLLNNDLINEKETRNKYKTIGRPIYSARIGGKKSRFYYAMDLCLAISTALDRYEIELKLKDKPKNAITNR